MSAFKGDYMGFTYNNVHSSDLGIVRTSDGSRFNENLLPTIQDKTVPVPGGDGTYYFGSYYTQRQFSISFAFDGLTEQQLERLRAHFGDRQVHDLIFDEMPYKAYQAKVTGSATIKYIPFAEGETNRVYKGEGSIQFTCYDPYAVCTKKFLDEYTEKNKEEWAAASGLLKEQPGTAEDTVDWGNYDTFYKEHEYDGYIKVYNPGVKEADCVITLKPDENCTGYKLWINRGGTDSDIGLLLEFDETVTELQIDSKNKLILSKNSANGEMEIYNEYIVSGDFFAIPQTDKKTDEETYKATVIKIKKYGSLLLEEEDKEIAISYNYYYF